MDEAGSKVQSNALNNYSTKTALIVRLYKIRTLLSFLLLDVQPMKEPFALPNVGWRGGGDS